MAQEMPTMLDKHSINKMVKNQQKASIALSKLADPVYLALSSAQVFNLSLEPAT